MIDNVKVGEVGNIDFSADGSGDLIVSMKINKDINLPNNSVARLSEENENSKRSVIINLHTSTKYYKNDDTIKSYEFQLSLDC